MAEHEHLSFWQELKRRNVVRAATVYLITAWLLIEIITTILPLYEAPNWISQIAVILIATGFPIAVIFAWIFEMSPKGMVKTTSVESKENPLPAHKRKPLTGNWIIGLLIIIVIAQTAYISDLFASSKPIKTVPITVIDVVNQTDDVALSSLSGLIITALQNSKQFSVLTRNRLLDVARQLESAEVSYIDEKLGIKISKQENVPLMVSATVQNFGNTYTIDLKVLDVSGDSYFFTATARADTKDNIPEMIDEVTFKLRNHLEDEPINFEQQKKVADQTTSDMQAYYHYFKGKEFYSKYKIDDAINAYKQAIEIDSTFALAYYDLTNASSWNANRTSTVEYLRKTLKLLDRLPYKEQQITLALKARFIDSNFQKGLEMLKLLKNDYPNDKDLLYQIGDLYLHRAGGQNNRERLDSAFTYLQRVYKMDSTADINLDHMIWVQYKRKQYESVYQFAESNLKRIYGYNIGMFLISAEQINKYDEAMLLLNRMPAEDFKEPHSLKAGIVNSSLFKQNINADRILEYFNLLKTNSYDILNNSNYANLLGMYKKSLQEIDQNIRFHWNNGDSSQAANYVNFKATILFELNQSDWHVEAEIDSYMNKGFYWEYHINKQNEDQLNDLIARYDHTGRRIEYFHLKLVKSYIDKDNDQFEQMKDSLLHYQHPPSELLINYLIIKQHVRSNNYIKVKKELNRFIDLSISTYGFAAFGNLNPIFLAYPYVLYYKARLAEQEGKREEAIKAYEKFLNLWKYADKDIPELIEAKKRYKQLLN